MKNKNTIIGGALKPIDVIDLVMDQKENLWWLHKSLHHAYSKCNGDNVTLNSRVLLSTGYFTPVIAN